MDNANTIERWVNYKELIKNVKFIVIPRKGIELDGTKDWYKKYPHIFLNNSDIIETSSTKVRTLVSEYYKTKSTEVLNKLRNDVEMPVLTYIIKNKLYLQYEKTNRILQQEITKVSS